MIDDPMMQRMLGDLNRMLERAEKAEAELVRLQRLCDMWVDTVGNLEAERDKALEWYAARSTGEPCWHSGTVSVIHLDGGQVARDALAGGSDPLERLREHNRVSPAIFAEVAGGSVQESGCSETDSGWYWNKVEEVKKPVHEPCPVCGAIGNPRLQCDSCVVAMAQTGAEPSGGEHE